LNGGAVLRRFRHSAPRQTGPFDPKLMHDAPPGQPLRIAVLAPISWRVPPVHYGPWEQFVSLLTEGLVERGQDVTLFATENSLTTARLVPSAPRGYSECATIDAKVWEALHISACFERASEFDVIHNSFDFLPLTFSGLVETPVVTTVHGFSSERILPVYQKYDPSTYYVAISEADRHWSLNYAATIHHGIDMSAFALGSGARDKLLFFGRIHPDKGTAEAISIARLAGLPLVIAGIIQDQAYFANEVEPHIDGKQVTFLGPIGPDRKSDLLGSARALIHYVSFDEPFGFSVVEAMACGTPVIATRRGSMPELIEDGVNGRLVDSVLAAAEAVGEMQNLSPTAVRGSVARRFSDDRMVDEYLALYRRILAERLRGLSH
jgi:glycosyltransferase involved in cell wall biosynthesis